MLSVKMELIAFKGLKVKPIVLLVALVLAILITSTKIKHVLLVMLDSTLSLGLMNVNHALKAMYV